MSIRAEKSGEGFTLIGVVLVIVILGIIAGIAVPVIFNLIKETKYRLSLEEMAILKKAIIGDPGLKSAGQRTDFGFVGDIGRFPNNLDELVTRGALPAWNITTGIGWHGPYVETGFQEDPNAFKKDGWANLYTYSSLTAIVASYGSDGTAGGTGYAADFSTDDLTSPTDQRYGQMTGRVTDILGNPLADTATTDIRVRCYYPVNGSEAFVDNETDSNGAYQFSNIPLGKRRLEPRVAGVPYPIKTAIVTPDIDARVDFQLSAEVTIPNAPSSVSTTRTVFSDINSNISLDWQAPTQNTDGSALTDLAGYNIYRSLTSGFTPSASNRITTVGLVSEWTDFTPRSIYRYYYIVRAVDKAGNESANSSQVSSYTANGGGTIKQVAKATGWNRNRLMIGIKNFSGANITVSSLNVSWTASPPDNYSGGGQIRIFIRIPSSITGWTWRDNDSTPNGNDNPLDFSFTLDAYGTTNNDEGILRIGFDNTIAAGTSVTIQFNPPSGPSLQVR